MGLKIGELKYGMVIVYSEKKQYCFTKGREMYSYLNYIELNCNYECAIKDKTIISNSHKLFKSGTLCAGNTICEFEI